MGIAYKPGGTIVYDDGRTALLEHATMPLVFRRFDFEALPVLVREPEIAEAEIASPLVLFLHGSGERGVDAWSALRHGLPRFAARLEVAGIRIAVPQCPPGERWSEWVDPLASLLDALGSERAVVTGFSMGGRGAWAFAQRHPTRVFRLSPVAGRLPPETTAGELARALPPVPTWVLHSQGDERVPVADSDAAVAALAAIGRRPRYTRYEGLSHVATSETAYADAEYLAWLSAP
jgi:predicted peptidase